MAGYSAHLPANATHVRFMGFLRDSKFQIQNSKERLGAMYNVHCTLNFEF